MRRWYGKKQFPIKVLQDTREGWTAQSEMGKFQVKPSIKGGGKGCFTLQSLPLHTPVGVERHYQASDAGAGEWMFKNGKLMPSAEL